MQTAPPDSCVNETFILLCAKVDYWRGRALRAEKDLHQDQMKRIRQDPVLWKSYRQTVKAFGGNPDSETKETNEH